MSRLPFAFFALILFPVSLSYAEPAVAGTILTFYITDSNLSTDHRAVMTIPTAGLVDFTINGVPVSGPDAMVETGIDTGTFQVQFTVPSTVGGAPIKDGDVVVMTYHQQADYSGNPTTLTQSKVLHVVPSGSVSGPSSNVRIGNYFKLRIYAPDYNLDSFTPDDIPLDMIEVHMGGAQTTLADPVFQTNPYTLRETGDNTDMFSVTVKMPKTIAGYPVEMGSTIEFRFADHQYPSSTYIRVGSGGTFSQNTVSHAVEPLVTAYATNSLGTNVNFTNSNVLYGFKSPICSPPSGTFFSIGKTTVTCAAKDQNGNSVIKSFVVNVMQAKNQIHAWIKKPVGLWCSGLIDDLQIQSTLKYLAQNNIIALNTYATTSTQTPDKNMICGWANGQISDDDVANSIQILLR